MLVSQKSDNRCSKQEMQIINLKWLLFPYWLIFFKINRGQTVDDIDKLYKFHENLTRNANFQFKMASFPLLILRFFFKINRVQATDEIDNLCKFH